ncbi:transporter [Winogradskyella sp. PC-19]|uniref:TolC family protein n=1 Tax=unclassified Winogradskyella TaxID=2615021 RepID=UPI000B3CAC42|nr:MULTISPECIES: TolC family protein [unclassified Winogradskyella]ARV09216.1 transporter [Winogradskyella sp. PC-19]RZN79213.1 MAG: TolC family protein [Winogradskyella sp.]
MKKIFSIIFIAFAWFGFAQVDSLSNVLRFDEYLGYVKKFHPIVKQANLVIDESQAKLLKSRGAFDPKIDVDYDRKKFKGTEYFDKLNGTFKIPTWFGVELKASFEENTGDFLNPEAFVPEDGLYSAGVSVPVLRGLLINDRMASLKQAKLFREQAKADRDIYVNNILFEASKVYFKWLKSYNELKLFENFLVNAEQRYRGIVRGVELGENAQIDATEARIAFNSRKLSLEQSRVKMMKASLELSTFLWLENNIPVELQPNVVPDIETEPIVDATFNLDQLRNQDVVIDQHPKIQSLDFKRQSLNVERRLKANMLLPRVDLEYNFLTETPDIGRSFNTQEYKGGVNVSMPLFLRKERGDLKLAKIKLSDTEFEINATRVNLQNKINGLKQELDSYVTQNEITVEMVSDYQLMLRAEERKFQLGESSLFLVNSRESKLIEGQLKAIEIQNKFFNTKAKLFNSLAVNPEL